jgi:hypothetical protein
MVVNAGDKDGESDASPQFLRVGLRCRAMHPQRVDDLGIGMLAGLGDINAEHRRRRDIHQSSATLGAIEAPNQRHRAAFALNQTRLGGTDPCGSGQPQRERNLPIDSRPSSSTTVHFGRNPPSEVPRPRR